MSQLLTSLKAAVVAVSLGAVVMPAPAMAQANLTFNFGIKGGGNNFSFSIGKGGKRVKRSCLKNNEIRRALRDDFDDIRFVDNKGVWVVVIAEWERNGKDYEITINRCSGEYDIDPVRKRKRDRDWDDDYDWGKGY